MEGCLRCDNKTSCNTCIPGYVLLPDRTKCTKCPNYCTKCIYNSSKKTGVAECEIDGCNNGYYLNVVDTVNLCADCSSKSKNVARCNSLEKITQCVVNADGPDGERIVDHDETKEPPHRL